MSKFVAKFRKERDYNDDYEFPQGKKRTKRDPTKRLMKHNIDQMLQDYDSEYQMPVRRAKRMK